MTPEQFWEEERKSDRRSEYHGGEVFPMELATAKHADILANLMLSLGPGIRKLGCKIVSATLAVAVRRSYVYPDVVITCAKQEFADSHLDILLNPKIIFEVLSQSTADYDRGAKFAEYRKLPSLTEYITVAQDSYAIEHHVRRDGNFWVLNDLEGLDGTLQLDSLDIAVPLRDIYAGIELAPQ